MILQGEVVVGTHSVKMVGFRLGHRNIDCSVCLVPS